MLRHRVLLLGALALLWVGYWYAAHRVAAAESPRRCQSAEWRMRPPSPAPWAGVTTCWPCWKRWSTCAGAVASGGRRPSWVAS